MKHFKRIRKVLKKNKFLYTHYMNLKKKTVLKWKQEKKVKVFQKNVYSVINDIEPALVSSGLTVCSGYGTLLGFVREGNILKQDDDIDFWVLATGTDSGASESMRGGSEWKCIDEIMERFGMKKTREFFYKEMKSTVTYARDGVNVDVDMFEENADGTWNGYSFYQLKRDYNYGTYEDFGVIVYNLPAPGEIKQTEFDGTSMMIPQNSDEILSYIYGEDWRVPKQRGYVISDGKPHPIGHIDKVKAVYYVRN